ncbi:hypothetical protein SAMN05421640_3598 [Ekhidna lutea]|uniref:Transcription elongation factor, GreA/GreB, C-term n=1 Tax=Ekhidna lutea TaxID=447679 RepID=A0A239M448_EKHLU|nr:hypothetical protein [Ekhidna lutea]SNT36893.1 hypothetical protein SAMN05421640_3598 [Ekhidna lutea]
MELKKRIQKECLGMLRNKIKEIKSEIDAVQESAISDTKSSMGDKYETGREVMMQEKNKLNGQLEILLNQLTTLEMIEVEKTHERIRQGSLVETDKGTFFISVPFGQMTFENKQIFVISSSAPLAQEMAGKTVGESFSFNTQTHKIKSIA